jgi:hypothetical protein
LCSSDLSTSTKGGHKYFRSDQPAHMSIYPARVNNHIRTGNLLVTSVLTGLTQHYNAMTANGGWIL